MLNAELVKPNFSIQNSALSIASTQKGPVVL